MEYDDELDRMRARGSARGRSRNQAPKREQRRDEEPSYDRNRARASKAARRRRRKRKILIAEFLILAVVLAAAFFFLRSTGKDNDGYWTVAVFGVDSRDGKVGKGALSDVIMIANLDRETGEIKLVSVFRDTYMKINQKGTYHKINEAYAKGGADGAVKALEENLDLHIDDYVTFNWKAVADTINILGGVDIDITDKEFAYINSFITETVNSTGIGSYQLKSAGPNHLDGVQAVAYSRLRLMDTDFNRTERQRKVVSLAMEKAKNADFSVLNNILVTVLPQVGTSVNVTDLIPLAKDIKSYHLGETAGFPFARGTTYIGKMDCVIPLTLESNVVQLHQFLFGEEVEYTPSGTVRKISAKIAEDSGMSEVGKNAPTGQSSGGGKKPKETAPPETTPVPETEVVTEPEPETTAEPSTEETTEKATLENGELVGPGATEADDETQKPAEETEGGPGVEKPAEPSKAPETTAEPVTTEAAAQSSAAAADESKAIGPGE